MVDVGGKAETERTAIAEGVVTMRPETLRMILDGNAKKGDVLGAARIAGIMAAKKTHELIPLCHPLLLTKVSVDIEPDAALPGLRVTALARVTGKTGVEMEALTAASVACLTIYDMAKAVDRGMVISGIRLVEKTGGKSGDYRAAGADGDGAAAGRRGAASGCSTAPSRSTPKRCRWPTPPAACWPNRVTALRTQPPFPASAMDGYAVRAADVAAVPARLTVIGKAPAGSGFAGAVGPGEAVRIFTGAPVPDGADTIAHPGECATRRRRRRSRCSRPSPPAATSAAPGWISREGDIAARRRPRARCRGAVAGGVGQPSRACRSCGSRWSRSSPPATNCCRPAASPGPTRSSPRTPMASRRSPMRPAPTCSTSASSPDRMDAIVGAASASALDAERRRHRDAGRRLGRRPRPGARGADRRSAWRSTSGRSPCGPGKPLMFGRLGATRVHRPARQSGGEPGLLAPVPEAAAGAARRAAASSRTCARPCSARRWPPTTSGRTMCARASTRTAGRARGDAVRHPGFLDAEDCWPTPTG